MVSTKCVFDNFLKIKSKAVGADQISSRMLFLCCPYIIKYITHLINYAIEVNTFPNNWKVAFVVSLPKVKHPTQLSELRPVSILPVYCCLFYYLLAKLLERILFLQFRVMFQPTLSCLLINRVLDHITAVRQRC